MKAALCLLLASAGIVTAADRPPQKWLPATAYVVPKHTATEGEGYFSIIEGHNRRLYVGTHANAVNSWLVEFDPASKKMAIVVDAHQAIGTDLRGFGAQAKIHTRNNTGKQTGRIYFGTKQGYPSQDEKREDYPGGYPMVYDPQTGKTRVYPIPVPHHGINSIMPDESRGVAYISTCSDHRPGPGESSIFLTLDLKSGKYRTLIDTEHSYGFIVVDWQGRAYHPLLGGDIARYDPKADRLERLQQTIDGQPPTAESRLALTPKPDPINWDISPDGKTLYAVPMSGNALFAYDLTASGNVLLGRRIGTVIPGATKTDCRAVCVGPSGAAWCAMTEKVKGVHMLHLVRYTPGDAAPVDLGVVEVHNPDFTKFTDQDGQALPFHAGFTKLDNGKTVSRYVIMGVCEARDGNVYILALHPYTVLQVRTQHARAEDRQSQTVHFRVRETAGIRRRSDVVSTRFQPAAAIDRGSRFRVLDKGQPVPAQIRTQQNAAGDIRAVDLDFITDLAPLENRLYELQFGPRTLPAPEPTTGFELQETAEAFEISNRGKIVWTVRKDLQGLLRFRINPDTQYVRDDSRGFTFRTSDGVRHLLADRKPSSVQVIRKGPIASALRYEFADWPVGSSSTIEMEFVRTKSWVHATWTLAPPGNISSMGAELHLDLQGHEKLIDFGADDFVYTTVRTDEAAAFVSGPQPIDNRKTPWAILRGKPDALQPLSVAPPGRPLSGVGGWAHVMDDTRCTAIAVHDFGRRTNDRMQISGNGQLVVHRGLNDAAADQPQTLEFWIHFVGMPVHRGARTSPQAMRSPPQVTWLETAGSE